MRGPQPRTAAVLYGSETGNAQEIAEELGRLMQRLHFSTLVTPLDAVEPASFSDFTLVLIAISTTGQGDLPASSRLFFGKLLRKKLPPDYLSDVSFALFGLGDSSYPKFNYAAVKLYNRMLQLSAVPIIEKKKGDEQHPEGIDSTFLPWASSLREKVLEVFPLPNGLSVIDEDALLQPQWLLADFDPTTVSKAAHNSDTAASNAEGDMEVILESNNRVTPTSHWQDVRHITLQSNENSSYAPGDILTIYPENPKDHVDQLLSIMGWDSDADRRVAFTPNTNYHGIRNASHPTFPCAFKSHAWTLRYLLTHHLDMNAIPRRSFFAIIQHFTADSSQRDRLREFCDPKFIDDFFDYATRPRRSILEVLHEFDTLNIPWQWAAIILPPLRGRQFSIASGGRLKHDANGRTRFELLVAIVKYKTVLRKIRRGTCTRYLEKLAVGSKLKVTLVRGSLGIDFKERMQPVIMIGPGTGVAPMRSLIWERKKWNDETLLLSNGHSNGGKDTGIGEGVLFFGCRNAQADYFFEEEWNDLQVRHPLRVHTAFSRDQAPKVYVQNLIQEHRDHIFRLIHELNGIIYICGSSGKMPQAVRVALVDTIQHGLSSSREDAELYLMNMEKEKRPRYKQETW